MPLPKKCRTPIAKKYHANVKIVEVPSSVSENYGPDYAEQIKIAQQVKDDLLEQQTW